MISEQRRRIEIKTLKRDKHLNFSRKEKISLAGVEEDFLLVNSFCFPTGEYICTFT